MYCQTFLFNWVSCFRFNNLSTFYAGLLSDGFVSFNSLFVRLFAFNPLSLFRQLVFYHLVSCIWILHDILAIYVWEIFQILSRKYSTLHTKIILFVYYISLGIKSWTTNLWTIFIHRFSSFVNLFSIKSYWQI